ncbi:hypothetical protein Ancab_022718 [Ancistrocladus abbreviatus]
MLHFSQSTMEDANDMQQSQPEMGMTNRRPTLHHILRWSSHRPNASSPLHKRPEKPQLCTQESIEDDGGPSSHSLEDGTPPSSTITGGDDSRDGDDFKARWRRMADEFQNLESKVRALIEAHRPTCRNILSQNEGQRKRNSPLQEKILINPELYRCLIKGDIIGFQQAVSGNCLSDFRSLEDDTVLHIAEILGAILDGNSALVDSFDEEGRTPLSYAAYIGYLEGVQYFHETFSDQTFKPDCNGYFPIHWACSGGHERVVKHFLQHFPKTSNLLTKKGQNILHIAALNGKANVVEHLLKLPEPERLMNLKDVDGNTPLHLATIGKHPKAVHVLTKDKRVHLELQNKRGLTPLDAVLDYAGIPSFKERLMWLALTYADAPRASHPCRLRQNTEPPNSDDCKERVSTPSNSDNCEERVNSPSNLDNCEERENSPSNVDNCKERVNSPSNFDNCEERENSPSNVDNCEERVNTPSNSDNCQESVNTPSNLDNYKERVSTLLLVATLVATVTFAAGFTLPGGYNQDDPNIGMATLVKKRAFQVFVISNTIAMYSSILVAIILIWAQLGDLELIHFSLKYALPMLGVALTTMSVAFMVGVYLVVSHLHWLAVVVMVMGCIFLAVLLVLIFPLYSPSSIKNQAARYIFSFSLYLMLLVSER